MFQAISLSRTPFACKPFLNSSLTRAYATNSKGPNHAIIEMLTRHMHEEDESSSRNPYKVRAFMSAIKVLKQLDHPLRSIEEAKSLKSIGTGIARRIEEHFTAEHHELPTSDPLRSPKQQLENEKRRMATDNLQRVTGVGAVKARNLVAAGCVSISDMRKPEYYETLTSAQKVGLRFVDQIPELVTREQAETVLDFIRDNISSKFEVHLGGSYRRGAERSGDMDIILFHPSHVHVPTPHIPPSGALSKRSINGTSLAPKAATKAERESSPLTQEVVIPLQRRGLIAATLSAGVMKWQGVVRLPERDEDGGWGERSERVKLVEADKGLFRRLDLNLVPWKSRGAALLALTGDIEFNRDIRARAVNLGMHLNEFGLWRWQSNGSDETEVEAGTRKAPDKGYWELVKADTEEEILRELGLDFIEPTKRNFLNVVGKQTKKRTTTRKLKD